MSQAGQAGVWPIVFQAEGIDDVKAAVETLRADLEQYAAAGDGFAQNVSGGFAGIARDGQSLGASLAGSLGRALQGAAAVARSVLGDWLPAAFGVKAPQRTPTLTAPETAPAAPPGVMPPAPATPAPTPAPTTAPATPAAPAAPPAAAAPPFPASSPQAPPRPPAVPAASAPLAAPAPPAAPSPPSPPQPGLTAGMAAVEANDRRRAEIRDRRLALEARERAQAAPPEPGIPGSPQAGGAGARGAAAPPAAPPEALLRINDRLEASLRAIARAYAEGGATGKQALGDVADATARAAREARTLAEGLGEQQRAERDLAALRALRADAGPGRVAGAFEAGRRGTFEAKPVPPEVLRANERLEASVRAIQRAHAEGSLTGTSAMRAIGDATDAAARSARAAGEAVGRQQRENAEGAKRHAEAQQTLGRAFQTASGFLMGWVRAGMQGTAEGNYLGLRMQLISREVASLFTPAIHAAINAVDRLYDAFRDLTGGQQRAIGGVLGMGVATLGLAAALPKVSAGLGAVGVALKALWVVNPFVAIAGAVGTIAASTPEGRRALLDLGRAVEPLVGAFAQAAAAIAPFVSILADRLTPVIQLLADIIGSPLGPWLIFAGAVYAYGPRIVSTFQGITGSLNTLTGKLFVVAAAALQVGAAFRDINADFEGGDRRGFGERLLEGLTGFVNEEERLRRYRARNSQDESRQDLSQAGGQIEQAQNLYLRLTAAAAKTDHQRTVEDRLSAIERNTRPEGGGGVFRPRPAAIPGV